MSLKHEMAKDEAIEGGENRETALITIKILTINAPWLNCLFVVDDYFLVKFNVNHNNNVSVCSASSKLRM